MVSSILAKTNTIEGNEYRLILRFVDQRNFSIVGGQSDNPVGTMKRSCQLPSFTLYFTITREPISVLYFFYHTAPFVFVEPFLSFVLL